MCWHNRKIVWRPIFHVRQALGGGVGGWSTDREEGARERERERERESAWSARVHAHHVFVDDDDDDDDDDGDVMMRFGFA